MPSDVEQELVKATKFKPPKNAADRDDYLAALARAANKLDNDTFDEISELAADWVNAATEALNRKQDIPEFPDFTEDEEVNEASDSEESEDDVEDETAPEEVAEVEEPKKPARHPTAPGPKPKPHTPPVKKPKRKNKPSDEEMAAVKTRYDDLTGEKDRFGIIIGTKTHEAVQMYERGTTSVELKDKLGGRYYNILKKLQDGGHLVERSGVGMFKITHKDDAPVKKAKNK